MSKDTGYSYLNPAAGHGHVYPRPDGMRARCGGPPGCRTCAGDAALKARVDARKAAILAFVVEREAVTFADLAHDLPGFEHPGAGGHSFLIHPKVAVWANMAPEAAQAVVELQASGHLLLEDTPLLTYLVDGVAMSARVLPPDADPDALTEVHWQPVLIRPGAAA